eukprot:g45551.t1
MQGSHLLVRLTLEKKNETLAIFNCPPLDANQSLNMQPDVTLPHEHTGKPVLVLASFNRGHDWHDTGQRLMLTDPGAMGVGFLFPDSLESSWSATHNQGRYYVQERLGLAIRTIVVPKAFPNPKPHFLYLLSKNVSVIICAGTQFLSVVKELAPNYTSVDFLLVSSLDTLMPSLVNIGFGSAKIWQALYLAGILAGSQTKSKVVAAVMTVRHPSVLACANSFLWGVQMSCPTCTLEVMSINAFRNSELEFEAAKKLMQSTAADVFLHMPNTVEVLDLYTAKGHRLVGFQDQALQYDYLTVTSALYVFGPIYESFLLKRMRMEHFDGRSAMFGLSSGSSKLGVYSQDLTQEVISMMEAEQAVLTTSPTEVLSEYDLAFCDHEGRQLRNAKGDLLVNDTRTIRCMTEHEVRGMNYFLQGVSDRGSPVLNPPPKVKEPLSRATKNLIVILCIGFLLCIFLVFSLPYLEVRRERRRRKELAQKSAFLKRFLSSLSHEVRTPLNGVFGSTALLELTELDEEQRSTLADIKKCAQHLLTITNDILDLTRLDSEKSVQVAVEVCDVRELLDNSLVLGLRPGCSAAVSYLLQPKIPKNFLGDSHRIEQVLVNLISNASKFCDGKEIAIIVRTVPKGIEEKEVKEAFSEEKEVKEAFRAFQRGGCVAVYKSLLNEPFESDKTDRPRLDVSLNNSQVTHSHWTNAAKVNSNGADPDSFRSLPERDVEITPLHQPPLESFDSHGSFNHSNSDLGKVIPNSPSRKYIFLPSPSRAARLLTKKKPG